MLIDSICACGTCPRLNHSCGTPNLSHTSSWKGQQKQTGSSAQAARLCTHNQPFWKSGLFNTVNQLVSEVKTQKHLAKMSKKCRLPFFRNLPNFWRVSGKSHFDADFMFSDSIWSCGTQLGLNLSCGTQLGLTNQVESKTGSCSAQKQLGCAPASLSGRFHAH